MDPRRPFAVPINTMLNPEKPNENMLRNLPPPHPSSPLPAANINTNASFVSRLNPNPRGQLRIPSTSAHLALILNPDGGPTTNSPANDHIFTDDPGKDSLPSVDPLLKLGSPPSSSATKRRIADWVDKTIEKQRRLDRGQVPEIYLGAFSSTSNRTSLPPSRASKKSKAETSMINGRGAEPRGREPIMSHSSSGYAGRHPVAQPLMSNSTSLVPSASFQALQALRALRALQASEKKSKVKPSTRARSSAAPRGRGQTMTQPTPGHTEQSMTDRVAKIPEQQPQKETQYMKKLKSDYEPILQMQTPVMDQTGRVVSVPRPKLVWKRKSDS